MMNINRIIKILIGADLMFMIAYGFLNPVFAVFLVQSIQGGTIKIIGIAFAILWLTKSVFRIPIAFFLDKKRGENDDFYSMIIGFLIFSLSHFLYLFAKLPVHVYGIQFVMGIGAAFAFTPWYGFFARHIDRHHESFEWSIEVSLAGFGMAAASFATGMIADKFGFSPIFIISGIFSLIGTLLLLFIGKNIKMEKKKGNYGVRVRKKK